MFQIAHRHLVRFTGLTCDELSTKVPWTNQRSKCKIGNTKTTTATTKRSPFYDSAPSARVINLQTPLSPSFFMNWKLSVFTLSFPENVRETGLKQVSKGQVEPHFYLLSSPFCATFVNTAVCSVPHLSTVGLALTTSLLCATLVYILLCTTLSNSLLCTIFVNTVLPENIEPSGDSQNAVVQLPTIWSQI